MTLTRYALWLFILTLTGYLMIVGRNLILPIVLAASIVGAVVGIAMKVSASLREGRYVPFGPFLAGGGLAVMLAGPTRVLDLLGWV